MTNKEIIASIWRSGYMKDRNKIRQKARESMRSLIAHDIAGNIPNEKEREKFLLDCNLNNL